MTGEQSETTDKRHRLREASDDPVRALLYGLSFDELITAFVRLSEADAKKPSSRTDAIEAIEGSGRSTQEVLTVLHEVEASSPKAHCFFATLEGAQLRERVVELLGETIQGTQVSFALERDGFLFLTLERIVEFTEWSVSGEPGSRIKQEATLRIRHAAVLKVTLQNGRATISYPPLPRERGSRSIRS